MSYLNAHTPHIVLDRCVNYRKKKMCTHPHLITLLFGENRGLEELRRVVAARSGIDRVDVPIPYEPDQDIVPFEEADLATRLKALMAASWLFEGWPSPFAEYSCEPLES
jgi:hypothetical protein